MLVFLGLEGYAGAGSKWRSITLELEPMLKKELETVAHPAFDSIAVISVIMPEEYLEGYKERAYLSRKNRYADIRLHLDYKKFVNGPLSKRKALYAEHLVSSVRRLEKKMKTKEEIDAYREMLIRTSNVCEAFLRNQQDMIGKADT